MGVGISIRNIILFLLLSLRLVAQKKDSLPEVTVHGYAGPGSAKEALRLQKAAGLIPEIVPEATIGRSADLSIADVTRRVNGLSVTTDHSGQTEHTIIRGMDPRYNYTLVNGIKIPSPGDRSRYVPLSIPGRTGAAGGSV